MLNLTIVQGRLTADPEIKLVGEGIPYCTFTVAWNEKYKGKEEKLFLRCKTWRSKAEVLKNYFHKGKEIIVVGELITEKWEKDGQKYSWEVLKVRQVHFCGKADKKEYDPEKDFVVLDDEYSDDNLPF